jgi:hypothetical protein
VVAEWRRGPCRLVFSTAGPAYRSTGARAALMVRRIGKLWLEEPCGCVRIGSEAALPLFLLLLLPLPSVSTCPRRRTLSAGDPSRSTPHLHARKGSYPPSLVPSRARTRTRTIANPSIYTPRLLLLMLPPAHSVVTYSHVAPIARAGSSQQGNKDGMEGEETAGNDMGRQLCKAATTQDGDQTTTADEPNKGPRYVPTNMLLRCRGDVLAAAGTSRDLDRRQCRPSRRAASSSLSSPVVSRGQVSVFHRSGNCLTTNPSPRPH